MKTMSITVKRRQIDLAVAKPPPSDQEAGSAERTRLYHSGRWQRARRRFLTAHPLCVECEAAGFVVAAVAVDHRDGHRCADWRRRFWDETTWQPLCLDCHNRKSAAELADWNRAAGTAAAQPQDTWLPGSTTQGGKGVCIRAKSMPADRVTSSRECAD
jgi:hypothetical protein